MNYEHVRQLATTPRQVTPALVESFNQIVPRPFAFLPWATRAWDRDVQNSPIVLAKVVQAHPSLYSPSQVANASAILVHAVEPSRGWDRGWLSSTATTLRTVAANPERHPHGKYVASRLLDPEAAFSEELPDGLNGGVTAHWCDVYLDPEDLPNRHLPPDGIIPVWLRGGKEARIVPASLDLRP